MLSAFFLAFATLVSAQVWPGDINDNGEVNTVDVLYWALSNNTEGPPRPDGSLMWVGQPIENEWTEAFPDGQNFAYADCNGDGQIDLIDHIIIQLNQDSSRAPYLGEDFSGGVHGEDPLIWLGQAEDQNIQTSLGSELTIPIHLGTPTRPVEDFFGLAFRILIDTGFIGLIDPVIEKEAEDWLFEETAILTMNLDSHFEEPGAQGFEMAFYLLDPTATTSGYGKIADLKFIIEDDLTLSVNDTTIAMTIIPIRMIDNQLSTLDLAGDTTGITIYQDSIQMLPTGELETTEEEPVLKLYPNPTSEVLELELDGESITSVAVHNILNQLCRQKAFPGGEKDSARLEVQHLAPGPYWLYIRTASGKNIRAKFIKIDNL